MLACGSGSGSGRTRRKVSAMRKLTLFILILSLLGAIGYVGYKYLTDWRAEKDFSSLMTSETSLKDLHKKNKDCIGIIKIKGTRVNYPVMQNSKDNPEKYLRKNFKGQYSVAGTPFLSAWSKLGKSQNYLIFGHNMKSGGMFHDILKYEKKKFYQKHKYIEFENIKDGKGTFRVIAAFRTETYSFNYPGYGYLDGKRYYDRYVGICKDLSAYSTGKTPRHPTQLLTLSTCAYHASGGRFVVLAEKISE